MNDADVLTGARIHHATTNKMAGPSPAARSVFLELPPTVDAHAHALSKLDVLRQLELGGGWDAPGSPATPPTAPRQQGDRWLKTALWNAERCKYIDGSAALLASLDVDIVLLAEMDFGMARSGQSHTTSELAERLGFSYVFAPEFVELGLGDARERGWFEGQSNTTGLHGAAILSRLPVSEPALIRLPETGDWFDGTRGERRIGGRIVVVAKVETAGRPVVVAVAHLESHGGPVSRADEIASLLPVLQTYAGDAPILLGGDFNTNSTERNVQNWDLVRQQLAAETPGRLANPVDFEPMFDVLSRAEFNWEAENAPGPTQRTRPDGTPTPPFAKLDWFFSRGLDVREPQILPALAPSGVPDEGMAISDHELLTLQVRPASCSPKA